MFVNTVVSIWRHDTDVVTYGIMPYDVMTNEIMTVEVMTYDVISKGKFRHDI